MSEVGRQFPPPRVIENVAAAPQVPAAAHAELTGLQAMLQDLVDFTAGLSA